MFPSPVGDVGFKWNALKYFPTGSVDGFRPLSGMLVLNCALLNTKSDSQEFPSPVGDVGFKFNKHSLRWIHNKFPSPVGDVGFKLS